MELPSHSLRKRSNFGFVFRTLQPDVLLLLSAYTPQSSTDFDVKDVKGNYSVSLMSGKTEVWIDNGKEKIELRSNLTLNDGEYHVVTVSKTGRKFELRINDEVQSKNFFTVSPAVVNMPGVVGGLFLGGAPSFPEFDTLTPTFTALEGAMKNLVFNNATISFEEVLHFKNVHMGGTGPEMGGTIPMKTEAIKSSFKESKEGCHRVSHNLKF